MGVTVHFEGQLRDQAAYEALLNAAIAFAASRNWQALPFELPVAKLNRVRDEQDWDYEGPTKGIELRAHPSSEPIRLEFDDSLYIQEYTKTQFAPPNVHKELIALLDELASHFVSLTVVDEGEYFESRDEPLLLKHRDRCFEVLDEHLANDKSLRGPVRLPSGRIADLVRDA
jgi:hypothetical protein